MTQTQQPDSLAQRACTTLLFPFVSNSTATSPQFDTAIVITNASAEPFGSEPNFGSCRVHYFGHVTGGGAAPPTQTSSPIPPGSQLVFTLSTGGSFGIAATPGFQGYLVIECFFPDAYGFAMIGDIGFRSIATAYLAQVLRERLRTPKPE